MSYIEIISNEEQKIFNNLPKLSYQEKKYLFEIPLQIENIALSLENDTNKFILLIMYLYFKLTNKFYNINYYTDNDINLICKKYKFLNKIELDNLSIKNIYRYKQIIKQYLLINPYTNEIKNSLIVEATILASNFVHRKKIFYALVDFSKKLKIEVPSYTELSKIITIAINSQKKDILDKLEPFIKNEKLNVLDDFLQKDTTYKNKWQLSNFKKLEHGTNKKKMISSLTKFTTIKSKFQITQSIIDTIGLTPKIAQYHAQWIEKSQVFQVKRKKDIESNFLLLSFVYYQYLIRNDNLIDRFISTVQTAKNSSIRAQKEYSFEQEPHKNRVIQSLEDANIATLNEIERVIKNSKLSAVKKVKYIEGLVQQKTIVLKNILKEKEVFESINEKKYDFIESKSVSLQGKFSGILKEIEFDEKSSNKNIIKAINYFRDNAKITNNAPDAFLDDEEKIAIFDGDKFRISLYKILLFFHISDAIKNGTLNLKYSYRYKNFDDYMISKEKWKQDKDILLKKHEMEYIKDFNTFIKTVETKVEQSYKVTNENVSKGFNTYFTANEDSFILKTPKLDKSEDEKINTLAKYFPSDEYLSIIDLLSSINKETDFLSSFQHFNQSNKKQNHNLLLASILGYGCNLSLPKIGKISKGINENQLDNTKIWYFTEENTQEANDKIVAYMDKLEIVKYLRHNINENHTSSDGQKYTMSTNIDSTNAGYSSKYFGANKGVVAYTFIDESHRLFHSQVINVSQRESGYVIDGLLDNETVKSSIHSSDTHGYTEIIFGLTDILGFNFGPRIKNFKNQYLYAFNTPRHYHGLGYTLIPNRKINTQKIQDSWDDILRFAITIRERKTTATQLLKRLTSYSKQHKLHSALKEYGKIIKTDFLLNYIDDVTLRQRIEKQLNKVESSNKFSKAVFFGNNQEYTVSTVEEQNIANNSKRLIQNAIILWNYLYITKKLQQVKNQTERDNILQAIKNSSIIYWNFINFYGTYDFTTQSKRVYNLIALDDTKGFIEGLG